MAMLTRASILVGVDETDEGVPTEFRICAPLHVMANEPLDTNLSDSQPATS
jgi:hypothetical protein